MIQLVVGAVLGVALKMGADHLAERGRRKHEDQTRWHPDNRAAARDFLAEVDEWVEDDVELCMAKGPVDEVTGEPVYPISPDRLATIERLQPSVDHHRDASKRALVDLEMSADRKLVATAKDLRSETLAFLRASALEPMRPCGGANPAFVEADHAWQRARMRFVDATRAVLRGDPSNDRDPHDEYAHGRFH